ncbi:hypothetical protein F53441_6978 [Fusarium austroafricanum]|uniref:Uncharacterized protein n=1 Tax=Fusarium austroafricanum TaxID=2364996 RepID=A0A8H4KHH6_9HYPO|nr:hypothetical protein F53441_6978 [Fusarium austroafricanum]
MADATAPPNLNPPDLQNQLQAPESPPKRAKLLPDDRPSKGLARNPRTKRTSRRSKHPGKLDRLIEQTTLPNNEPSASDSPSHISPNSSAPGISPKFEQKTHCMPPPFTDPFSTESESPKSETRTINRLEVEDAYNELKRKFPDDPRCPVAAAVIEKEPQTVPISGERQIRTLRGMVDYISEASNARKVSEAQEDKEIKDPEQ